MHPQIDDACLFITASSEQDKRCNNATHGKMSVAQDGTGKSLPSPINVHFPCYVPFNSRPDGPEDLFVGNVCLLVSEA